MAAMDDVYMRPGHLIRRAHQIAVAIFMEETAAFGLTPVQYGTLVALREFPGSEAARLATLVAFDRSTMGSVLARLEAKGLIVRAADPADRRAKIVRLKPAAHVLLREVEGAVARTQTRILEPLAPGERRAFARLLVKLVHLNNQVSRSPLGARPRKGRARSK
jgi:DNA-binding MarR family transcriptional regulator